MHGLRFASPYDDVSVSTEIEWFSGGEQMTIHSYRHCGFAEFGKVGYNQCNIRRILTLWSAKMSTELMDNLKLDDESIHADELSMPVLKRELNLHQRPNWLLVKMMNALEQKRQKKGLGWSRAWNKYGMNNFRSHICDVGVDGEYLEPADAFLSGLLEKIDGEHRDFVKELLADPSRMVFTFYHNAEYDGVQYEGVTFSMGRKVPDDRTKRDRVDIVLEDRRVDGAVDGTIDRIRVYVCPWASYEANEFQLLEYGDGADELADGQGLYDHLVDYHHRWKGEEDRQWSHWSVRYIDYFGARAFIPQGSSFT